MKHIIIIASSVTSKRISAVELARRLHKAGYRVTIAGSGGDYTHIDDFEYFQVDIKHCCPEANPPEVYCRFGKTGRLMWQHLNRRLRKAEIIRASNAQPFQTMLVELNPDLVLLDVEEHYCILAALPLDIPVGLFSVFFNLWKRPKVPPLHSDVVPGKKLSGQALLIELLWLRFRFWKWFFSKRDFLLQGAMDERSLFSSYAESLGLELREHVDFYQWLIPFAYRSLLTLVLNPQEMEFPLREPAGTIYVGPMICTDRSRLPFLPEAGKPSSKLDELLDRYRNGRPDRHLVYCSFGSYFGGDDTAFLKKLAASFKDMEWDAVFALGDRLKPAQLGNLPDNVHCFAFAPQMEILEISDCAVIHGGMTTAYECIHFLVPMVVYPFNMNDQLGTAARISYHGLGLLGDRVRDSSSRMRNHISKAMGDPTIRGNLERMKLHLSRYADDNLAAQAVGRMLMKNHLGVDE
jgi:zeaxanthin glucosyltransferase